MTDKNIVELKIDVEFLDRERVKIIETLEKILERLDDMDEEITTKNLIVTEKATIRDLEVTNQVVEDLALAKDLTVSGKTTTNDLEVSNQVTGDLAVTGDLDLAQNLTVANTTTTENLEIGSGNLTVTQLTTQNGTVNNDLTVDGDTSTKDVFVRNTAGTTKISLLGDDADIVIDN